MSFDARTCWLAARPWMREAVGDVLEDRSSAKGLGFWKTMPMRRRAVRSPGSTLGSVDILARQNGYRAGRRAHDGMVSFMRLRRAQEVWTCRNRTGRSEPMTCGSGGCRGSTLLDGLLGPVIEHVDMLRCRHNRVGHRDGADGFRCGAGRRQRASSFGGELNGVIGGAVSSFTAVLIVFSLCVWHSPASFQAFST